MPLYDYECATCGRFSALRGVAVFAEPATCPACGAVAPRLLLSTPQLGGGPGGGGSGGPQTRHVAGCACCGPVRPGALRAESV